MMCVQSQPSTPVMARSAACSAVPGASGRWSVVGAEESRHLIENGFGGHIGRRYRVAGPVGGDRRVGRLRADVDDDGIPATCDQLVDRFGLEVFHAWSPTDRRRELSLCLRRAVQVGERRRCRSAWCLCGAARRPLTASNWSCRASSRLPLRALGAGGSGQARGRGWFPVTFEELPAAGSLRDAVRTPRIAAPGGLLTDLIRLVGSARAARGQAAQQCHCQGVSRERGGPVPAGFDLPPRACRFDPRVDRRGGHLSGLAQCVPGLGQRCIGLQRCALRTGAALRAGAQRCAVFMQGDGAVRITGGKAVQCPAPAANRLIQGTGSAADLPP